MARNVSQYGQRAVKRVKQRKRIKNQCTVIYNNSHYQSKLQRQKRPKRIAVLLIVTNSDLQSIFFKGNDDKDGLKWGMREVQGGGWPSMKEEGREDVRKRAVGGQGRAGSRRERSSVGILRVRSTVKLGGIVYPQQFFAIQLYLSMKSLKLAASLLMIVALASAQSASSPKVQAIPNTLQPLNKGLTFQATVFPSYENNWAGRFSCNNCNPFEGDQPCTKSLPILCISHHMTATRPYHIIAVEYTPFAVTDGGYYDSWTGGVFSVTLPVRGSDISSYKVGDDLCKGYFGNNSRFAKFDDGRFMEYMNRPPQKTWSLWDWANTKKGGWNMWGYFNHHYRGRAWVWIDGQPSGNCGN